MRATSFNRTIEPSGLRADDDFAELLLGNQPALRANSVSEFLALAARARRRSAGRIDSVLRLIALMISGTVILQLGQLVRLHPNAHRVLARAEDLTPGDARHAASVHR